MSYSNPLDNLTQSIASPFFLYYLFHRQPNLGLNHLLSTHMVYAYKEFGHRFPQLNPCYNAKVGWKDQVQTSPALIDAMQAAKSQLISRTLDRQGANPCYRSDVIRLCRVIDPSPNGYMLAAYMHASLDLGHRGMSFIRTMPSKLERRGNTYWISVHSAKSLKRINFAPQPLSTHTSFWLTKALECKEMGDFANPNTIFCFSSIPDIDKQMDLLCCRAGYPKFFFTSGSLRKGYTDTIVCNAILEGKSFKDAVEMARTDGGWSCTSNVVRFYISDAANLCLELRAEPNPPPNLDALILLQQHPNLAPVLVNGNLPGPFRAPKTCVNEGETTAFQQACQSLWMLVRNPVTDPQLFHNLGGNTLGECLRTLGSRFFNNFGLVLPASYDQAVQNLRTMQNGNLRSVYRARGRLLNMMIRSKIMVPQDVANNVFVPLPLFLVDYCALNEVPPNYVVPERPLTSVDASSSTHLPSVRMHALGRLRPRRVYSIYYNGNEIPLTQLTNAQCELLVGNNNPTLAAWNWAATLP